MKKTFLTLATAAALLVATGAWAQSTPAPQPCPRCGTPQQGQGPRDGTGYGARSGNKAGKRTGPQDGRGQRHRPQGRRAGR